MEPSRNPQFEASENRGKLVGPSSENAGKLSSDSDDDDVIAEEVVLVDDLTDENDEVREDLSTMPLSSNDRSINKLRRSFLSLLAPSNLTLSHRFDLKIRLLFRLSMKANECRLVECRRRCFLSQARSFTGDVVDDSMLVDVSLRPKNLLKSFLL